MAWQLVVSPVAISHHAAGWRKYWRDVITEGLNRAEEICRINYFKYTNKASGRRIRSEHISKMLRIKTTAVTGSPRAGDKYTTKIDLEGTPKWMKIAEKQEVGGEIRAKSSRLLTIPNRRFVRPNATAAMFPKARWAKIGGRPFLVRSNMPSKPKVVRKPNKPIGRRPARKVTHLPADVLFLGVPSVNIKPKHFFRDSMAEATRTVEREFSKKLTAAYEKLQ